MIEPVIVENRKNLIKMSDMKPYDIGVVMSTHCEGSIVMRTASTKTFEVMNLTNPREDGCWCLGSSIQVRLLKPGSEIVLKVK